MEKRKLGKSGLEVSAIGLEENIGAVNLKLSPEDLREIDSAAAKIKVQGARYPEALEKRTGL